MLKLIGKNGAVTRLEEACWVDLCDPTEEEIARVQQHFGMDLPSRESLSEIEVSSRLRAHQGRLVMSAPLIARRGEMILLMPTGFVLTADLLVTIRFAEMAAFDMVQEGIAGAAHPVEAQEALVRLLEELVDRAADRLERVAEELTSASHAIFREYPKEHRRRLGRETRRLRRLMVNIGRSSEQMVKVRQAFLAIGRIANFTVDRCEPQMAAALKDRLVTIRHDIESLDEFESSLTGRVQLLLDAATGFISIEQNDVVKVLTVASVAGVPPVLVVGIYGMNFHYMPELAWSWGYPFALALIVFSTILPVLWFRWRDWL